MYIVHVSEYIEKRSEAGAADSFQPTVLAQKPQIASSAGKVNTPPRPTLSIILYLSVDILIVSLGTS